MAQLITDTADIKTLAPNFQAATQTENIDPYVADAACLYLHDYLSEAYYTELVTQRNADTLTPANEKVVNLIRKSLAYFTLYDLSKFTNAKVSSMGMMTPSPQNGQFNGIRQWEKNETKQAAINKADQFLDKALEIMYTTPADYPTWQNSEAYTEGTDLFITSSKEFSNLSRTITRRTFMQLISWQHTAEDKYILSAIGSALLSGIKSRMISGTLSANDNIILPMLKKALAWYTLYMGAPDIKLDISNHGIRLVTTDDGISSYMPADKAYHQWHAKILDLADSKLGELKNYLETNYEDFPEYESSTAKENNTPRTGIRDNTGSKSSVMI